MTDFSPNQPENTTDLSQCKKGSKCVILGLVGVHRDRLSQMGFNPGTRLLVANTDGSGSVLLIMIKGYQLALRKDEAKAVLVRVL